MHFKPKKIRLRISIGIGFSVEVSVTNALTRLKMLLLEGCSVIFVLEERGQEEH